MAGAYDRDYDYANTPTTTTSTTTSVPSSTDSWAVATGGNTDPFYTNSAPRTDVTVNGVVYKNVINAQMGTPPPSGGIGSVSPSTGLVITGIERDAAKEREALLTNQVTKEYIASRGGINAQGYYNDTPLNGQLTAAERKSVTLPNGNINTAAMWEILNQKQGGALGAYPGADAAKKVIDSLTGGSAGGTGGGSQTTSSGGYDANGNKSSGGQYDANGNYVGTNLSGGTSTGSATGTLAIDTFKATLGLFVGKSEMGKPWVNQLYTSTSKFYKSGSTIEEAFNMAVQDVRNNPAMSEFTKRFKGIYDLTDKRQKGEAVYVPTVAEYFSIEKTMGDVLRQSNLGELANEDFLGGIIGKAVSVTEFANRIQTVFDKIDYAPEAVKKTISTYLPYVDRSSLAKAILTGEEGAKELQKKVSSYEVLTAAQQQGLGNTTLQSAADIANQGYGYQQALAGFGEVKNLERANTLASFTGGTFTQEQAQQSVFQQDIKQQNILDRIKQEEVNRYRGSSGNIGSKALASQNRNF